MSQQLSIRNSRELNELQKNILDLNEIQQNLLEWGIDSTKMKPNFTR